MIPSHSTPTEGSHPAEGSDPLKSAHSAEASPRDIPRRDAIRHMGLAAVGLAIAPIPGFPLAWFRQEEVPVPFTDVPATFTGRRAGAEAFPGANRFAQDLRNLTQWLTPIEDHFVVTHYGIPEVDGAAHRLRIGGLVRQPLEFTMADLRALPRQERTVVFECGGNGRGMFHGMVGNARWVGAELLPLLERAGLDARAREIHFFGADTGMEEIRGMQYEQHFGRSMSLDQIRETSPILAYEMNGQPLPVVHGSPVRLLVPGWYGVSNVKWLQRIEVSENRLASRFMARDYVTLMGREVNGEVEWVETLVAHMRPKSVIARVTRVANRFTIYGAAWTDGTPLDRVEVQVDGGAWTAATLDRPAGRNQWTFFTHRVEGLAAGEHTLVSRAFDGLGRTQPENLELKRTRWENNELFTRTIAV